MAQRGLRIQWASSYYQYGRDHAVRIRITAVASCDMPTHVFAYRCLPTNPETGAAAATFSHVCSPVDLAEYPEDAPVPGASPQWFRATFVDILVRSTAEAANFLALVREDLRALKAALDRIDTLIPGGTEEIDALACEAPEESSDSNPSSSQPSVSEGPLLAITAVGSHATNVGAGVAWTHTGAGAGSPLDDASLSSVVLRRGQASQALVIQGFDFSELPAAAVIAGISITVKLRDAGSSLSSQAPESAEVCALVPVRPEMPGPVVLRVMSLHAPSLGALTNAADTTEIPVDFTELTAGGDDVLWGSTDWSAAVIKSGEFGAMLVVGTALATIEAVADVDGAEITIYYR